MVRKTKVSVLFGVSVLVLIGLFGWLVWLSPYRFDQMKVGPNTYPVRINRFTGETELLLPTGWKKLSDTQASLPLNSDTKETEQDIPGLARLGLTGQANITYNGFINVRLYNGTRYRITEIVVNIIVRSKDGAELIKEPP